MRAPPPPVVLFALVSRVCSLPSWPFQRSSIRHDVAIAPASNGTRGRPPGAEAGIALKRGVSVPRKERPTPCNARTLFQVAEDIASAGGVRTRTRPVRVFVYDPFVVARACENRPSDTFCATGLSHSSCGKRQRLMGALGRRLNQSSALVQRTLDPSRADLFLLQCYSLSRDTRVPGLVHLSSRTAHRHMVVAARTFEPADRCELRTLRPVQVYNLQRPAYCELAPRGFDLSSLPYPSDGPRDEGALRVGRARPVLATFIANVHGGAAALRYNVRRACRAQLPSRCTHETPNRLSHAELLALKARSLFCLEVAGDTPYRQSLTESLLAGCVPVLLSAEMEPSLGLFWHGWRNASRVRATWHGGSEWPPDTPRSRRGPKPVGAGGAARKAAAEARSTAGARRLGDEPVLGTAVAGPVRTASARLPPAQPGAPLELAVRSFGELLARLEALRDDGVTVPRMQAVIARHAPALWYALDLRERGPSAGAAATRGGGDGGPDALDTLFATAAAIADRMDAECNRPKQKRGAGGQQQSSITIRDISLRLRAR